MRVRDVMTRAVVTVSPTDTVRSAAGLLVAGGFTMLPVTGEDGRLLGVVTEADLLADRLLPDPRLPLPRRSPRTGPTVGDVLDHDVVVARPEEAADELVTVLRAAGLRSVPVVRAGAVVGVVTLRDLLRGLARDDELIMADVRRRLNLYFGIGRWQVDVHDGEVGLVDDRADPDARRDAVGIAEAVLGVAAVRVEQCGPVAAAASTAQVGGEHRRRA